MTSIPDTPSATGTRYGGDDYQMLLTWRYALGLLHPGQGITKIEMEAREAGNLDDLVIHFAHRKQIYHQIKWVTDQRDPMTYEWFMERGKSKTSILEKFWASFQKLSQDGVRPHMVLHTNRVGGPGPLTECIDGQKSTLMPRIAKASEKGDIGLMRNAWAEHLGIDVAQLLEMLEHLEIRHSRGSLQELQEHCSPLMEVVGLAGHDDAINAGMLAMRALVREGNRELEAAELRTITNANVFAKIEPRARLVVQQIDHSAAAETATASVDWVHLFEGGEPQVRRRLIEPDGWNTIMRPDLQRAVKEIRETGMKQVVVAGHMRLSAGMVVGRELASVAGFRVAIDQYGVEWSTSGDREVVGVAVAEREVGQGDDIAIAVGVSVDPTDDVLAYLKANTVPVAKLVVLTPAGGVSREAIAGPAGARGMADAILDSARTHRGSASALHLFPAMPLGLALLLGHIWNHVPTTQLYEATNDAHRYVPAFTLPA